MTCAPGTRQELQEGGVLIRVHPSMHALGGHTQHLSAPIMIANRRREGLRDPFPLFRIKLLGSAEDGIHPSQPLARAQHVPAHSIES